MFKRLLSWLRQTDPKDPTSAEGTATWVEGYAGQSTDELIGLANTHRVDSVILAFEEAILAKADRRGLATLTPAEVVVLAVEAVEREVNNGGFDQLFRNSSHEYATDYIPALQAIGRPDVAELAREAIDALNLKGLPTATMIERALERDDETRDRKLNELDGRYFEVAGDLAPSLLSFIRSNRADIVLPA